MAQPIPKASDKDIGLGWIRGHDFVREIDRRATKIWAPVGMEEVQAVLNVLIEMGHLEQAS